MSRNSDQVRKRNIKFTARTVTKIWDEQPAEQNPYLAQHCRCHGYELVELMKKCTFSEMVFLLFHGELPTIEQARLLDALMVAFINPGPRHPATRAAMNAGVSKTKAPHILPIALSVLGGGYLGGEEVEAAMLFLKRHQQHAPARIVEKLLPEIDKAQTMDSDHHIAPGFGSRFGGIDPVPRDMASILVEMPGSGIALRWGIAFVEKLKPHKHGWLSPGVVAAVLSDLGFSVQAGSGLYQLICSPGLLAHGLELASPYTQLTAMPFLDEEHYVIEPEARKK